jgi:hypothetical protein
MKLTFMGTMKEADKKAAKRFCIAWTVLVILVAAMIYFNLFDTYLNDYFKRAGTGWNIISVFPFAGSIYFSWKLVDYTWGERGAWLYGVIAVGGLALGILFSAGFNFDLHGIEPGV